MSSHFPVVLPWVFAGVLMLVHHFGEHLNDTAFAHQENLTSLSAGVTITYVFLQLLPEHHKGIEFLGEFGSLTVLGGFAAMHLAEKWVYHHEKSSFEIRKDFKELHSLFLFLYYFGIGLLLFELVQGSVLEGTMFFIPVLLHTAISSFSLLELDEAVLNNKAVRYMITVSALLGVATAFLLEINPAVFHIVLGTITGMFLYVVIHDSLPAERSGKPIYFLTGTLLYSLLMIYIWTLI